MIKSGIYEIKNLDTGKIYIGSAKNIKSRWYNHRLELNSNNHKNTHLQNAWNLYGENKFKFSKLEEVAIISDLISREQYWMDKYNCCNSNVGYNLCKIAGSRLGTRHTNESKEKIRLSHLGKFVSEETRVKISKSLVGKQVSEETRAKLSRAKIGKKASEATKEKLRNSRLGKKLPQCGRVKSEKLKNKLSSERRALTDSQCLDLLVKHKNGVRVMDLSKEFSIAQSTIYKILSGKKRAYKDLLNVV